jgi:hypothetical protein
VKVMDCWDKRRKEGRRAGWEGWRGGMKGEGSVCKYFFSAPVRVHGWSR